MPRGAKPAHVAVGPGDDRTLTPTYQKGVFFARAEASYVGIANGKSGLRLGRNLDSSEQVRLMLESASRRMSSSWIAAARVFMRRSSRAACGTTPVRKRRTSWMKCASTRSHCTTARPGRTLFDVKARTDGQSDISEVT